jgi:hypothetical protein
VKILAGGPARETSSDLFRLHVEGLEAQGNDNASIPKVPMLSARTTRSEMSGMVVPPIDLTIRHEVVPDPGGARWQHDKVERVAVERQKMMQAASCFDGLLMVDTDVILGPGVLERMLAVDADVAYGVFWTRCTWGGPMGDYPQTWNINPYGWTPECAAALRAEGVNEVEVYGGGACTLFRGRAFESRYHPLLESLRPHGSMWAGEDRSYCLGLETRGIRQVGVTGLPIRHCYGLHEQTRPALERVRKEVGL